MMKISWRKKSDRGAGEIVDVGCTGRLFSYGRIPKSPMRLTVLRLDGTSFDVCVSRRAFVGELNTAVEEFFSGKNGGVRVDVSWSVVWGHFSLSYMNHNLLDKRTKLRAFGIKDGDTLKFIRKQPSKSGDLQ